MIKLVIVDFDDTLCLTEEATYQMESRIGLEMGMPLMDREIHKKTFGKPIDEIISIRIPGINVPEFMKRLELMIPEYINKGILDNVSDYNLKTLLNLKAKGKTIGMLTGRSLMELKHVLSKDNPLSDIFSLSQYKDNSKYQKPDPRVFDIFFSTFNVKPSEVLYIGDSINDGVASNEAQIHFIASLESKNRTKEDFNDVKVEYFVNKFTELEEIINKLDQLG